MLNAPGTAAARIASPALSRTSTGLRDRSKNEVRLCE
jgi:hypothetical protein